MGSDRKPSTAVKTLTRSFSGRERNSFSALFSQQTSIEPELIPNVFVVDPLCAGVAEARERDFQILALFQIALEGLDDERAFRPLRGLCQLIQP